MSRYATIVARELGLPDDHVRDIALAAALSNLGTAGLPPELLTKEGTYTDQEYERMKLHAEYGALIVEMSLGNPRAAEAIRYHHERIDGLGYPDGLRGDDIPIGARILAVVQTFLAAVNGRKHREPLSFDKALERLKTASGTQLDEAAADALREWYSRKRRSAGGEFKPLGACWEMCCAPVAACETCPAFGRREKPCWEVQGVRCVAHGKSCATCFVYTEAMERRTGREQVERKSFEA